jgi:hypothetical protein
MNWLALLAALAIGPEPSGLPENPCDLIAAADIAVVGQLVVQPGRRVPGKLEAGAGSICAFQTGSEFGDIFVSVPPRAERRTAKYWQARESYFATYPGSGRAVPGVGQDAWLGGGTSLRVLIRNDEYFTVTTQYYQPESGELLAKLARFVLSKF